MTGPPGWMTSCPRRGRPGVTQPDAFRFVLLRLRLEGARLSSARSTGSVVLRVPVRGGTAEILRPGTDRVILFRLVVPRNLLGTGGRRRTAVAIRRRRHRVALRGPAPD